MKCTDMWFEMEDDEDLIDASIYQRESLNARYRYLLRKAKENHITPTQGQMQRDAILFDAKLVNSTYLCYHIIAFIFYAYYYILYKLLCCNYHFVTNVIVYNVGHFN